MSTANPTALTRADFLSETDPRWCPGCGDFAALHTITKVFASMGVAREKFAVISGIGCSSRFPYYTNTYGFHTIHGRAPTVALGLKMVQPDMNVWVVTGDGDGLSIGGNHFIHLVRKNPDIKVILFNNQIYGLTKGQVSPTSPMGAKTKSTPYGSLDRPMHPLTLALGANATFVARTPDNDPALMTDVVSAAAHHKGAAVVEILINCVIFNQGAFENITDRATRDDTTVRLEAGKPLIFGKNKDRGIRMKPNAQPEVVKVGEGGVSPSELIVHDPKNSNVGYAFMLAGMGGGELPVPYGVLRQVDDYVFQPPVGLAKQDGVQKILQGSHPWKRESDGSIKI